MTSYTIGYLREDGDFAVLATLNNNDGAMSEEDFINLSVGLFHQIINRVGTCYQIMKLEREDAPDYINLEE